ncbi:hypothetical protein [Streptomyces sp. NPDC053069]|uniref:hypothetical protein n=1 Tax=Streptomyces sp. NPDC053069 TaxID=3365695 RepID=UPI0037D3BE6C
MTDLKERVLVDSYENTRSEETVNLRKEVNSRWVDLSLHGPDFVIVGASRVRDAALEVVSHMAVARVYADHLIGLDEEDERFAEAQYNAGRSVDLLQVAARTLARDVDEFALTASAALNDDGTRRASPLRRRRMLRRQLNA